MTAVATTEVSRGLARCFPARLYRFLEDIEDYDLSHVASWQPNGQSFRIHDPTLFVAASSRYVKEVMCTVYSYLPRDSIV